MIPKRERTRVWVRCLIALVIIAVMAPLVLGADEDRFGGTLRVAVTTAPPSLDWQMNNASATRQICSHIFEGLMCYGEDLSIIPQLAESWEISDDGLLYTFNLREGVLFHNEEEMTAEDVVTSLRRFITDSPRAGDFAVVRTIEALDKYTVTMLLETPMHLLQALGAPQAYPAIMPKSIIEGKGMGELGASDFVGTGPYKLAEYVHGERVTLERFEDYSPSSFPKSFLGGERIAYLDKIVFLITPEASARLAGLQTGRFDVAGALKKTDIEKLINDPNLEAVEQRPGYAVAFWLNKRQYPLSNVYIRQAIQAAYDGTEILKAVTLNNTSFGALNGEWFPEGHECYLNVTETLGLYNQHNIEKARELLKLGGYNGEPIRIITNKDYDWMYSASLVLDQNLKEAGFNSELVVLDWPGARARVKDPESWEIYMSGNSLRFSRSEFYYNLGSWYNVTDGPDDPLLDRLIREDMETFDEAERSVIWSKIWNQVHTNVQGQLIPCYVYMVEGKTTKVMDYDPFYMGRFWNVWLKN